MALPRELDFEVNREATPARMNLAMDYIVARLRALEAINPEFQSVIDELRGVGLERVTQALTPIFDDAQNVADAIEAIRVQWENDATVEAVIEDVTDAVTAEFADYRHRYLGAHEAAPTERDDGTPVSVGDMYFDSTLDAMRVLGQSGWKEAGSSVSGVLDQIDPIAATVEGQTEFTIPGGYEAGYLILTVNGSVIPPTDYTATNGTTVTLDAGISIGDEVAGVKFGSVTLATVYNKTQANELFRTIADSYTKAQVDSAIAVLTSGKADAASVYTRTQADERYAKIDFSNIINAAAARAAIGAISATQTSTLTNKRVIPRSHSVTTVFTPISLDASINDQYSINALDKSVQFNALSGAAPSDGQKFVLRVRDNGSAWMLTFEGGISKGFRDVSGLLTPSGANFTYPTTPGKTVYFGFIFNATDDRWDIVAVSQQP